MNANARKYLKVGLVLGAIGAVSALLITTLNLVTAPAIAKNEAESKEEGLKVIFPSLERYDADVALSGKYLTSYNVCYDADGEVGYVYAATGSSGVVKTTKILVGISGTSGDVQLGKVYFITNGATGAYGNKVVNNYVNPYNADPSEDTLGETTCGATIVAKLVQSMVLEAKDAYVAAKGGA